MRRKEFADVSTADIDMFLGQMHFGVLAFQGEEGPDITPLHFVHEWHPHPNSDAGDEPGTSESLTIYFHGVRIGHRHRCLDRDSRVCLSVAREYALIPSYFMDASQACFAGAFFKSVLVYGALREVQDAGEKARILALLMQKLQPEGGYSPLHRGSSQDGPDYATEMKGVSVLSLHARHVAAKFKFGQNLRGERRERVLNGLRQRNAPGDAEAVSEMKKRFAPE